MPVNNKLPIFILDTDKSSVNCEWTDWQQWSECSVKCGFGVRISRRKVKSMSHQNVSDCKMNVSLRTKACNHIDCKGIKLFNYVVIIFLSKICSPINSPIYNIYFIQIMIMRVTIRIAIGQIMQRGMIGVTTILVHLFS